MTKRERAERVEREVARMMKSVVEAAEAVPVPTRLFGMRVAVDANLPAGGWRIATPNSLPGNPTLVPQTVTGTSASWTGDPPHVRMWTSIGPPGPFSLSQFSL